MAVVEDMTRFGAEWSGMKHLKITSPNPVTGWSFHSRVEEEEYDVAMYVTHGPGYGKIRIGQGGQTIASVRRVCPGDHTGREGGAQEREGRGRPDTAGA